MQVSPVAPASRPVNPLVPLEPRPSALGPHDDARAKASADLVGGTQAGRVTVETLPNGVRIVVADRPGANAVKVQVGVGAGSLQDFSGKLGMAHLLEHLAFEGSPTHSSTEQEQIRASLGNNWNAYTDQTHIVYYGVMPNAQATKGAALLTDMYQHPATSGPRVKQEHAAVSNEMTYWGGDLATIADDVAVRQTFGDLPATNNVIGDRKSVARTTNADLQRFHDQYFTGRNTVALVEGDAKSLPMATLRRELGKLAPGARVDNSAATNDAAVVPGQSLQLLDDPASSTVTLKVTIPVATEKLAGIKTPGALLTTALSDRLFLKLRRNDHLTYGAGAKLSAGSNQAGLLTISTNVDKAHASKAMEDILTTLADAQDGFGEKNFATFKSGALATLRARDAAPAKTISELADETFETALAYGGADVATQDADSTSLQRAAIGRTTPKQFATDLSALLDLTDVKVLASGAVGDGAAIKAGITAGGLDPKAFEMNPVDLKLYRDMGIKAPNQRG